MTTQQDSTFADLVDRLGVGDVVGSNVQGTEAGWHHSAVERT